MPVLCPGDKEIADMSIRVVCPSPHTSACFSVTLLCLSASEDRSFRLLCLLISSISKASLWRDDDQRGLFAALFSSSCLRPWAGSDWSHLCFSFLPFLRHHHPSSGFKGFGVCFLLVGHFLWAEGGWFVVLFFLFLFCILSLLKSFKAFSNKI